MMTMEATKTISAVSYRRISHENQFDGYGLDAQKRSIENYAEARGLSIVADFYDDISGKTQADDRDGWTELKIYCEDNGISTIVVPRLDRLARDLMVQEAMIADLVKRGWSLISVAEGDDLCSDDPMREAIRGFMGVLNRLEAKMIARRMKGGREERVLQGDRGVGAVPYGYRSVEVEGSRRHRRQTIIHEPEAMIVREIFAMRCSGKSLAAIADALNDRNVPSPSKRASSSGRWHATSVQTIVNNAIYYGKVEMTIDGKTTSSVNVDLAIVDEATWNAVSR